MSFFLSIAIRFNPYYQICFAILAKLEIMSATENVYHNQPNHNPFKLVFTSNPSLGWIPNPRRLLTLNSRKATKCLLIHSPSPVTGEPNTGLPSFAFLLCSPATWLHTTVSWYGPTSAAPQKKSAKAPPVISRSSQSTTVGWFRVSPIGCVYLRTEDGEGTKNTSISSSGA